MFYGRKYELDIIESAIASNRAELGIVYGRRRIGKSTLLSKLRTRKGDLYFECLAKVSRPRQIDHFLQQLADQTGAPKSAARSWKEVFDALSFHIMKGKHYVVIDELPWMASGRTELVSLLKYYWDNRWKKNTAPGLFEKLTVSSLNSYLGACFENLCMKNLPSIMGKMGLDLHQVIGFGPFFRQRNRRASRDEGLQIDILVNRRGHVLTLIECKFSSRPVGTAIISEVERKIRFLKAPGNYTIERVLICGGDVAAQLQKEDYFHHLLGLDALL